MKIPDFIIIGETKCGTTSFYNYLIQHPNILDSFGNGDDVDEGAKKEIRYFDRYYGRGIEWYKSCFPNTKAGEITGEATPQYMYRTMAMARIYNDIPWVKFIVLLRNPVDRLYSNYNHNFKWYSNWNKKYPTFEKYLESASDNDYYLIDKGIYSQSLRKWFNYFPRDQFHFVITEEMRKNPQFIFTQALDFLGVKDYKLDKFELLRVNKTTEMLPHTRKLLNNFYKPYNEELYKLLGKKLCW